MTTLYFYNTKHFSALITFLHYVDLLICGWYAPPPHTTCKPHKEAKTLSCSPLRSQYLSQSSHSMNGERGG